MDGETESLSLSALSFVSVSLSLFTSVIIAGKNMASLLGLALINARYVCQLGLFCCLSSPNRVIRWHGPGSQHNWPGQDENEAVSQQSPSMTLFV